MKHHLLIILAVGLASLNPLNILNARAQVVLPLYSFYDSDNGTNGSAPEGQLTVGPDGNFYGTAYWGGISNDKFTQGAGTIFRLTPDGSFTNLVLFNGTNGANPKSRLVVGPDGNLYGATQYGGDSLSDTNFYSDVYYRNFGGGTVFRIDTNGTFTLLASFFETNGAAPVSGLTPGPDGNFYGTTSSGGDYVDGTIFRVTPGGELTTLTNFNNVNGASPSGGLTFGPDGYLYGATKSGGANGYGTVFRVATNGTSLTTLFHCGGSGTKGLAPESTLILGPDGNLYGTTDNSVIATNSITLPGGVVYTYVAPSGNGTIYRLTTNGDLTTLVDLDDYSEGNTPIGNLALGPDGNFYGTTYFGGDYGYGTIFRVVTNGNFTTLISLNGDNGAYPYAGLTLGLDNNFYGSVNASSDASGVLFRLGLPPEFIGVTPDQSVIIGNPASFAAQIFSTTPFGCQWLSNGVPVLDATNNPLQLPNVFWSANGATFQLVAASAFGVATNPPATLTVILQPNSYAISNSADGNHTVFLASHPNSANRLWTTTDLTLPVEQWQLLDAITTDANGAAQFLDTDAAAAPVKFYRLSYP